MELKDIGDPKYIALETFRKSGEGVITPVWAVAESGKLYVWTGLNSWKVKRMRANPRVRLAASDVRGNPESDWVEAHAVILDTPDEIEKQHKRLTSKYGLMAHAMNFLARFRGDAADHVSVEISPA